jgi:hypothetical protein
MIERQQSGRAGTIWHFLGARHSSARKARRTLRLQMQSRSPRYCANRVRGNGGPGEQAGATSNVSAAARSKPLALKG